MVKWLKTIESKFHEAEKHIIGSNGQKGKKLFYGDDISCRSTHKSLMWILDSPVAIHVDYLVWIILHWLLIYANTEGCSAPALSGRRPNTLSPDLGLFLPKQERQLEGERLPAGWRGSWRRREGSTGWQACWGQDRRGEQDAIQCLNLYFPRNFVCISLFLICTQFL